MHADIAIFAVGQLHIPRYPQIPNLEKFCGPVLHPAEWDSGVDFNGKRISVIGTGSSAVQMLPTLASVAAEVTVHQRSPPWILPKFSAEFGCVERIVLRLPGAHEVYRKALQHGADILLSPIPRSRIWRGIVERYAERNLRKQVRDEKLVQTLRPMYPAGSKRILFDNDFYPTLTRSKVHLVAGPIESVSEEGIRVADELWPADIIICATGFRAPDFLLPMAIYGRGGRSLSEDWRSGAEAFMGLAIHGYPKLIQSGWQQS